MQMIKQANLGSIPTPKLEGTPVRRFNVESPSRVTPKVSFKEVLSRTPSPIKSSSSSARSSPSGDSHWKKKRTFCLLIFLRRHSRDIPGTKCCFFKIYEYVPYMSLICTLYVLHGHNVPRFVLFCPHLETVRAFCPCNVPLPCSQCYTGTLCPLFVPYLS